MKINIGDLIKWSHNNILCYVSEVKNDHIIVTYMRDYHNISDVYAIASVIHNIHSSYFLHYPIITNNPGNK
jgi:hypothetical protein